MKLRITLLILAVILAAAAVVGVKAYINSIETSADEEAEEVEALTAEQNIPEGTTVETLISENMVETKGISRKYLVGGVLASLDGYEGYVAAVPINKGEQITASKLIRPEEMVPEFTVPEGMVAVSIPINEITGVSNLINIGDRVNIIATFFSFPREEEAASTEVPAEEATHAEGGESEVTEAEAAETEGASIKVEEEITKTLLWNVEVLYLGIRVISPDKTEASSDGTGAVTLAVTPQDSEKLVFVEEMEENGDIWLALVPAGGIEKEETPGRTIDTILDD